MDHPAIQLLNRILSASKPDETVCLPPEQARQLAELDGRALGMELKHSINITSPARALEMHGLFSRRVKIVASQADFSVNC